MSGASGIQGSCIPSPCSTSRLQQQLRQQPQPASSMQAELHEAVREQGEPVFWLLWLCKCICPLPAQPAADHCTALVWVCTSASPRQAGLRQHAAGLLINPSSLSHPQGCTL